VFVPVAALGRRAELAALWTHREDRLSRLRLQAFGARFTASASSMKLKPTTPDGLTMLGRVCVTRR